MGSRSDRRDPVFIALDLPLGIFVVGYGLTVLTTVVLYLLACDPLPPCQGRVWEWIARATPAKVPAAGADSV